MKRIAAITAGLVTGLILLSASPVLAQTPGGGHGFGPGPFRSSPPSGGGVGLMVMDRDQDREQLLAHLRLQECEPRFLGVTIGGAWRMYHPGAPEFVNRTFPTQLRAGDPFVVGCTGVRPDLRLDETADGTTVTLTAGQRLRVVLESNPSTGYTWVVATAPNAAVLVPAGEPFTVPAASDLLGAPGYQVFDFVAVAAGTTSVGLRYEHPTTGDPPANTWGVTVTVQ